MPTVTQGLGSELSLEKTMDNGVARVVGGIFLALSDAIGPDAAKVAHETLSQFAANPDLPAEDRRVYGCIAHIAGLTREEAEAENAEMERPRLQLRVIAGGATSSR